MRTHIRTKNLTEPEKAQFETYLEEKLKRIKPFLESHYPDMDTVKLDIRLEKHDRHRAFEFEYVLETPRHGHFVAKEVKHTITEVMDRATDWLERQVRRHFKKLTRE